MSLADLIENVQVNALEKTGILERLLDTIKTEVQNAIDQTAYEKVIKSNPQFADSGKMFMNSQIGMSLSAFKSARSELVQIANEVLYLYKPVVIWILTNPTIKSKRFIQNPDAASKRDALFKKVSGFLKRTGKAMTSRLGTIRIRKRSNGNILQKQLVEYLIDFSKNNPTASTKDKLIFGWRLVINNVASRHSPIFFKRDIQKRSIKVFYVRLEAALIRALSLENIAKTTLMLE
jgi:hypothetical protein